MFVPISGGADLLLNACLHQEHVNQLDSENVPRSSYLQAWCLRCTAPKRWKRIVLWWQVTVFISVNLTYAPKTGQPLPASCHCLYVCPHAFLSQRNLALGV